MTLARRTVADELMDADDLDADTYAAVVHDLAKVNTLTLARRPTLRFIDRVALRYDVIAGPMRILDVGFGAGDMLRAIARWSARTGFDVTLVGIDLNPRSEAAARSATPPDMAIEWRTGDYADLAGHHWDVVISSLVAHHMTHPQLVAFLRFMDREAAEGWFVNDLHRHSFAHWGYPILARLMRWHPIVRHDGHLSIARSYRPNEWLPILAEAGIIGARVSTKFPFRLCVSKLR
jgi:2-polyprenyl-3-methyl-5-hydroxy-6-metoxy-1,4-benzoquinol methylase